MPLKLFALCDLLEDGATECDRLILATLSRVPAVQSRVLVSMLCDAVRGDGYSGSGSSDAATAAAAAAAALVAMAALVALARLPSVGGRSGCTWSNDKDF